MCLPSLAEVGGKKSKEVSLQRKGRTLKTTKVSLSCWLSKTREEDPIWERQHLNELNGNQNPFDTDGEYQTEALSVWWLWSLMPWRETPPNPRNKTRRSRFLVFTGKFCCLWKEENTHRDTEESPGTNSLPRGFCFHDYDLAQTSGLLRSSKRQFSHLHWILCSSATWQAKAISLQGYFNEVVWGDLFCYGKLCSSSSLAENEKFITKVCSAHISLAMGP